MIHDFDEIDQSLRELNRETFSEDTLLFIEPFCSAACYEIRQRAISQSWEQDRYYSAVQTIWRLASELLYALHPDHYNSDRKKIHALWYHHKVPTYLEVNEHSRGNDILKDELVGVAASYLQAPDCQNSRFDYVLLDALIYEDLHAFIRVAVEAVMPYSKRFASALANGNQLKFALYSAGFGIVGFALNWLLLPSLAVYNLMKDNLWTALIMALLWGVGIISWLVNIPIRIKSKKKVTQLLDTLIGLYMMLDTPSLPPAQLKQALVDAAGKGVALDGAVFVLVDRMIARDPTMFAVPRI